MRPPKGVPVYRLIRSQEMVAYMWRYTLHTQSTQIPCAMLFAERLDFDALTRALNIEIARNDCMRLRLTRTPLGIREFFLPEYRLPSVEQRVFTTKEEQEAVLNADAAKALDRRPFFCAPNGPKMIDRQAKLLHKPDLDMPFAYSPFRDHTHFLKLRLTHEDSEAITAFVKENRLSAEWVVQLGFRLFLSKINREVNDTMIWVLCPRRKTVAEKRCGGTLTSPMPWREILHPDMTFRETGDAGNAGRLAARAVPPVGRAVHGRAGYRAEALSPVDHADAHQHDVLLSAAQRGRDGRQGFRVRGLRFRALRDAAVHHYHARPAQRGLCVLLHPPADASHGR